MKSTRAIFAARSVLGRLARPLPGLLHNLNMVQNCGLLTQDLPLVDESPFNALPDSVAAGGRGSQNAQRAGRADVAPRPASAPRPAPEIARTSGDTQSPVFSFRRKGSATRDPQPAPSASVRHDALGSRRSGGSETTPMHTTRTQDVREPPAISLIAPRENGEATAQSLRYDAAESSSSAEAPVGSPGSGVRGFELLNVLATELFAASAPVRSSSGTVAEGTPLSRVSDPSAEVSATTDRTSRNTPLSTPTRPPTSASAPEIEHLSGHDASVVPPLRLVRPNLRPSGPPLDASSALAGLDAETIASMVNEVLAEQARRHGVDLS